MKALDRYGQLLNPIDTCIPSYTLRQQGIKKTFLSMEVKGLDSSTDRARPET